MKQLSFIFLLSTLCLAGTFERLTTYQFNGDYDANAGKAAYLKHHCSTCHGADGGRKSATFAALTSLSAGNIKAALIQYRTDKDFGGRTKFIMQRYASLLSDAEIDNIIYYIKGSDLVDPKSSEREPDVKTKHNLFIK